jgi:hypothetical protein
MWVKKAAGTQPSGIEPKPMLIQVSVMLRALSDAANAATARRHP